MDTSQYKVTGAMIVGISISMFVCVMTPIVSLLQNLS